MDPIVGAFYSSGDEEFEPYCIWNRPKDKDTTLVIHLPEFKKEQFRVVLSNNEVLKIFGERSVDANKKIRFYKTITLPPDYNSVGINAKFVRDRLSITLPKKTPKADQAQTQNNQKTDNKEGDQSKQTQQQPQPQPKPDEEPYCTWNRQKDEDTLTVHLREFKKEQLRVAIDNKGVLLKISGERPIDATKNSRLYKEITLPADCNSADIRAKFVHDRLCIIMAKKPHSKTQQQQQLKNGHDPKDQDEAQETPKTQTGTQQQPPTDDHDPKAQPQNTQESGHENDDQSKKPHSETQQQQQLKNGHDPKDQAQAQETPKTQSETQEPPPKDEHDQKAQPQNTQKSDDQSKKTQSETQQQQPPKADEEVEPYCTWNRQKDEDTLTLRLSEFKKEQLRVVMSNNGVLLKIFGERPIKKNTN